MLIEYGNIHCASVHHSSSLMYSMYEILGGTAAAAVNNLGGINSRHWVLARMINIQHMCKYVMTLPSPESAL